MTTTTDIAAMVIVDGSIAPIRFRFSAEKALAAIHVMLWRKRRLGLHALLKACYFADKAHLAEHGRPVFGATYRAMRFGPVPLEIYEMAKGEPFWLAELGMERLPWRLSGYMLELQDNTQPDMGALSESDRIALDRGLEESLSMTFNERTAATHGPDWQAAKLGLMRYEDMLPDSPEKSEKIAYLREAAPFMRL